MKQILLLRGINLGKRNKVPMQALKEFMTNQGFLNVKTYSQTGNVCVETNEKIDIDKLEHELERCFGFSIPVMIRTLNELIAITEQPLFSKDYVMVIFFKDTSRYPEIKHLIDEQHVLFNNQIIIHYSKSYHKTKFTNNWFEKQLHTQGTLRNKQTILKMIERFSR